MSKNDKEPKSTEGDDNMMANAAVKFEISDFNSFLKANKDKINSIVPKNPTISKDDIWRDEDFWDENSTKKDK